ncbi:DUF6531 domain-containing protein [Metapseudomonas otitidis]|uniref:DUF6531 domain-containing protein n=1 Tax=Metapseudomonas otitidis TaxID=319939 RepID=UPI001CA45AA6|nr:DUF6531 domain-containing protein [Pseudomonas otitidis]QZX84214.1 DUF6531 domain-containing protein [Pseudomonas otitidis]
MRLLYHRLSVLSLILVSLLTATASQAEDYYWVRRESGKHFATPTEACKDADVPPFYDGEGNRSVIFARLEAPFSIPYAYRCAYFIHRTYFWGHPPTIDGPSNYLNMSTVRYGDSCPQGSAYDDRAETCIPTINQPLGKPTATACTAQSFDLASGSLFEESKDYTSPSDPSLNLTRTYNSREGVWRHNYSARLQVNLHGVVRVGEDGAKFIYSTDGGTISAPNNDFGKLTKNGNGWTYAAANNETLVFDENGQLIRKKSALGTQELTYFENAITVANQTGAKLVISEDVRHQPLSATAPGTVIQYNYDSNQRLIAINRTQGNVTRTTQLHYEDSRNSSLLTGVTDERGVRYVTWGYDDQGRIKSKRMANSEGTQLIDYNSDGTRRVTNELGKTTLFRMVTVGNIQRVSSVEGEPSANCPNSNSTFTYDDRGLVKTRTDNKGHVTTFDYNERGLEVSRTEAYGTPQARTVITEWHPTLFLPASVTEPDRVTTYRYDDQGRQLSRSVSQR